MPTSHLQSPKSGNTVIIILIIAAVAYILTTIGMLMFSGGKRGNPLTNLLGRPTPVPAAPKIMPTPTPLPKPLTSRGMYEYAVSGGSDREPAFVKGVFGPVDAANGQRQTLDVWIKSRGTASSVTAVLKIDHSEKKLTLTKSEETDGQSKWSASWTLDDTHDYVYTVEMTAKNSAGAQNSDTLVFR